MASSDLRLNLLVKKDTQTVIYAEANKKSADFVIDSISNPDIHKANKKTMLKDMEDRPWRGSGGYTFTDDLEVKPMSFKSMFTMLRESGANKREDVDEKVVLLGMPERELLEKFSSEGNKNVLTTIFLAK